MDIYHIWCDRKAGIGDIEFVDRIHAYLGQLQRDGHIAGFRVTRRKLGLGPRELGEFHITIEVDDMAALERAFRAVAARTGDIESLHAGVNQHAVNLTFALYRDFPDAVRARGGERF